MRGWVRREGAISTVFEEDLAAQAGLSGRNLTYGLLESIGRSIVVGQFNDGPFPTEAMLAERFGVSRSVTREAVKMLTAKGLLTARPRKGTSLQPPERWNLFDPDVLRWLLERRFSLTLLHQFNDLRRAIEPAAAALAARAANADGMAVIRQGYERMVAADAGVGEPLDADIAFHLAILRTANNPFFSQFQDVVATALRSSIRFTNRVAGHSASLEQHEAVLLAIEAGDAIAAEAAMLILIDDVLMLITHAEGEEAKP